MCGTELLHRRSGPGDGAAVGAGDAQAGSGNGNVNSDMRNCATGERRRAVREAVMRWVRPSAALSASRVPE